MNSYKLIEAQVVADYTYSTLFVPSKRHKNYPFAGLGVRIPPFRKCYPPQFLAGYFYIHKPFTREELLLDLEQKFGELEFRDVFGDLGLVCRMNIEKATQECLFPSLFSGKGGHTKEELDALAKNPPEPCLDVWFDEKKGYYQAQYTKNSY